MPDWLRYVRDHLSLVGCPATREAEIVEELADQLEDAYQEALRLGLSDQEACLAASDHVSDWAKLAEDLRRAGFLRPQTGPKDPSSLLNRKRPTFSVELNNQFAGAYKSSIAAITSNVCRTKLKPTIVATFRFPASTRKAMPQRV